MWKINSRCHTAFQKIVSAVYCCMQLLLYRKWKSHVKIKNFAMCVRGPGGQKRGVIELRVQERSWTKGRLFQVRKNCEVGVFTHNSIKIMCHWKSYVQLSLSLCSPNLSKTYMRNPLEQKPHLFLKVAVTKSRYSLWEKYLGVGNFS